MVEQGADARCSDRASSADDIEGATRRGVNSPDTFDTSEDCLSRIRVPRVCLRRDRQLFLLPGVIFNDNGVTLDDMTVQDIENAAGAPVSVVSCNPCDYLPEIIKLAQDERKE